MATTHIDFRKIDYDQLIDKPIIRTDASVDTLTSAGVYDKGDGKRYIVSVDGQNITQVIEEKDGYQERASSDGGSTWGDWDTVDFAAADIDAEDVNYDNTTSELQATNVQDAIDEIDTSIDDIKEDITEIKNIIEVTEMEEPSEENEGDIIQYKGETNANFTQGYFYKCVSDGQDPATYSWVRIDVQPSEVGDSHEFISLTAYNQLTPEQKAEKVYMITEEGVAPTPTPTDINAEDVNYDNTVSGLNADNVQDALDEVFQSVSNGKELIAAAITDKGVSTAASDSFQTMATNIGLIETDSKFDGFVGDQSLGNIFTSGIVFKRDHVNVALDGKIDELSCYVKGVLIADDTFYGTYLLSYFDETNGFINTKFVDVKSFNTVSSRPTAIFRYNSELNRIYVTACEGSNIPGLYTPQYNIAYFDLTNKTWNMINVKTNTDSGIQLTGTMDFGFDYTHYIGDSGQSDAYSVGILGFKINN